MGLQKKIFIMKFHLASLTTIVVAAASTINIELYGLSKSMFLSAMNNFRIIYGSLSDPSFPFTLSETDGSILCEIGGRLYYLAPNAKSNYLAFSPTLVALTISNGYISLSGFSVWLCNDLSGLRVESLGASPSGCVGVLLKVVKVVPPTTSSTTSPTSTQPAAGVCRLAVKPSVTTIGP